MLAVQQGKILVFSDKSWLLMDSELSNNVMRFSFSKLVSLVIWRRVRSGEY